MDRNFTLRWVRAGGHGPFLRRVHAPNGDNVGAVVEIEVSPDRQGTPLCWSEFVVADPSEFAQCWTSKDRINGMPDVLYVKHRDIEAHLNRVAEAMSKRVVPDAD